MICPSFRYIAAKDLDQYLQELFLDLLGYHHIEKDPDDPAPDRPEAWHLIVPIEGSRPFALAYRRGLLLWFN